MIFNLIFYSFKKNFDFRFPKDRNQRNAWIAATGIKNLVPNSIAGAFLCSKHFESDQLGEWIPRFSDGQSCRVRSLKKGAVPTIFDVLPTYDNEGNLLKISAGKREERLKKIKKNVNKNVTLKKIGKKVARINNVIDALKKKTVLSQNSVEACCDGTKDVLKKPRDKLRGRFDYF